ncbi:MAG: hypothetical protein F8N37_15790 [Telmatospirillum sp.]|nr:hypothetical protein [Telmatospirillum sp.]
MSRRRSRRNDEQRRRVLIFIAKVLAGLGAIGVTAYYAYEVGFRVAVGETQSAHEAQQKAEEQLKEVEAAAEADRLAQAQAVRQLSELTARYEQSKPPEELRDLTELLKAKMAAGVTARRLSLVIKSAEMPRSCQPLPTRRLLVRLLSAKASPAGTPLRIDDTVTLTAEAPGASDNRGGWFDPAVAVKVHVAADGARETDVSGVLPIDYALSAKGVEYHLTLSAANSKGWIDVAAERCSFR